MAQRGNFWAFCLAVATISGFGCQDVEQSGSLPAAQRETVTGTQGAAPSVGSDEVQAAAVDPAETGETELGSAARLADRGAVEPQAGGTEASIGAPSSAADLPDSESVAETSVAEVISDPGVTDAAGDANKLDDANPVGDLSFDVANTSEVSIQSASEQPAAALNAAPADDSPLSNDDSANVEDAGEPSVERTSDLEDVNTTQVAAQRQPIFEGWTQPKVALVFTGRQHGYIEPCGCTGLENQLGGMARRHTLLRQLAERGWTTVPMDLGNQVRRFGRQAEVKFQFTLEGLQKMQYQVLSFGPDDLRLPAFDLATYIAVDDPAKNPFVIANATIVDESLTPRYRTVTVNGVKIGVTAVIGASKYKLVTSSDISFEDPLPALQRVVDKLAEERCRFRILLAHGSLEESREWAKRFPQFDLVVSAGGAGEPTLQPEIVEGTKTPMIQVGVKGMFAGVVGLFDDLRQPIRYQRVPLDARFQDSRDMLDLMAAYQQQLESLGFDGLGIRPLRHPTGRQFVGSEACGDCHSTAYEIWKNGVDGAGGPHAHATESLIHPNERSEIPRNFDPECLSCHVTGWHPQRYFPYNSGYLNVKQQLLHGNGCENCHGPGSAHVAAENGDVEATEEQLTQLRASMRLPLEQAEKQCMECHDLDNSPAFHEKGAFQRYWEKIKHYGKD